VITPGWEPLFYMNWFDNHRRAVDEDDALEICWISRMFRRAIWRCLRSLYFLFIYWGEGPEGHRIKPLITQ